MWTWICSMQQLCYICVSVGEDRKVNSRELWWWGAVDCLWCSCWTQSLFLSHPIGDLEKSPDFGISCPESFPLGCPVPVSPAARLAQWFPKDNFHASLKIQIHIMISYLAPGSWLAFTRDFRKARTLRSGLGLSPECCSASAEVGLDQWLWRALTVAAKSPACEGGCLSPYGTDGNLNKLGTLPEKCALFICFFP